MTARTVRRRTAAAAAAIAIAALVLTGLGATPANAHGTMGTPVSRVLTCYAENPENPTSAACKAAVAAGGTQAFYDWNGVRIGDAAGRHQQLIPDGKLCSAGNDEFKGLDLARADWPATQLSSGQQNLAFRVTAQHKGTFALYITDDSYDPSQPLKWSDLESTPFATVTDPTVVNGSYVLPANVPAKSGRQLIYAIWQRSDSPEAFYSCSDVVFGTGSASSSVSSAASTSATARASATPTAAASTPSDAQIAAGASKSTVTHHHHSASPTTADVANTPAPEASSTPLGLAETGSSGSSAPYAVGGAAAVALGASVLMLAASRRRGGRRRSARVS
ncbi:lytic polysaccharide monooxygenase [Streptomyces sp. NPDC059373]